MTAETQPEIDQLYSRYAPMVASLGTSILGQSDDGDDLVQEVFLRAWRGLDRLENPGAVKAWLISIAIRTARTRLRRRRFARLCLSAEQPDYESVAAPVSSPEDRLVLRRLWALLDRLPADLRNAWVLRHVQAEKIEQMAEMCGWSLSTTKRRIAAADRRVEREMGR